MVVVFYQSQVDVVFFGGNDVFYYFFDVVFGSVDIRGYVFYNRNEKLFGFNNYFWNKYMFVGGM